MSPSLALLGALVVPALVAAQEVDSDQALRSIVAPSALFDGDFAASFEEILAGLERGEGHEDVAVARLGDLDLEGDASQRTAAMAARLEAVAERVSSGEASFQLRRMARRAYDAAALSDPEALRTPDLFPELFGQWFLVGPLGSGDEALPILAPPPPGTPEEDCASGRFRASYPGVDGQPRSWIEVSRSPHETTIRPLRNTHPGIGLVYAAAFLNHDGRDVLQRDLEVRCRGAFRAWWNGMPVIEEARVLGSDVGEFRRAPVALVPGRNVLLMALPAGGVEGLGARLLGPGATRLAPTWTQGAESPLEPWAAGVKPALRDDARGFAMDDPSLRFDDEQLDLPEGAEGRLAAMLRALTSRRSDLALTMPAPEGDPELERMWLHVRMRAIEAAPHLTSDARRRMLVETLEALQASGGLLPLARWAEVRLLLAEDRPLDAMGRVQSWRNAAPDQALPRVAEAAALGAIDRTGVLAKAAYEDLVEAHPAHVQGRARLMGILEDHGDLVGALSQAEAILRLDATQDGAFDKALQLLEGTDAPLLGELLEAFEARRQRRPGSWFWRSRVRRLHDALGHRDVLAQMAEQDAADFGADPTALWRLAGAKLRVGDRDGAVGALEAELALEPGDQTTAGLLAQLGVRSEAEQFFEDFAPDTDAALLRAARSTESSVVEALDDGLVYYFPSGAHLNRSHTLSIARDRTGTEALSRTPAVGSTREKRVLARDGRVLEPVLTNDEWVLPSLEPGDVVETVWDTFTGATRGGLPASTGWRFASFEKAFPTSRWVVYVPDALGRGRVKTGQFSGHHEIIRWGSGEVHVFEESSPRQSPEPWQPSYREVLPWGAFGDDRRREPELRAWRARTAALAHIPADLAGQVEAFALNAAAGHSGTQRAQAIYEALEAYLQDHQGSPEAARVWITRAGDPLCLLAAMYRLAGVDARWAIIERAVAPELDGEPVLAFAAERAMDRAALFVPADDTAGEGTWVIPLNAPGLPFGSVPAALGGATAYILQSDGNATATELPRPVSQWDLELQLSLRVTPDGDAEIVGRSIEGSPQGFMMRRKVSEATTEQQQGYALNVASQFARGADVASSEVVVDGSEGPGVVVVFEGTLPGFLRARGEGSVALVPFIPLQLDQRFGPAEREWPLALRQSTRIRATIEILHGADWSFTDGPRARKEVRKGLEIELGVDTSNPEVTRFTQSFVQSGAVVQPADVPAFLEAMSRLQAEFERPLELRR